MFYTNADGLLNKRDELLIHIEEFQPKIIAITEIVPKKVQEFIQWEYSLDRYDMFCNENPSRGVALYLDKTLNAQECILRDNTFKEAVLCHFETNDKEKCLVGCIYRSPNSTEENTQELNKLLKNDLIQKYDKVCLMGDFNFPNITWTGQWTSQNDLEFIETTRDAFLEQMVKEPTRTREGQRSNILDLILVNETDLISDIDHKCPLGKSDHQILTFTLYVNAKETEVKDTIQSYNLKNADYNSIRKYFADLDWKHLESLDTEHCWKDIRNKIHKAMEDHIPKRKNGTKVKYPKTYWMSIDLRKSVKKKYRLYRKYLESGKRKKGEKYQAYAKERDEISKKLKQERKNHEKNIATKCKQQPKLFWKYINSRLRVKTGISPLKNKDGKLVCDDQGKAEILNSYFSSVFTKEDTDNVPTIPAKIPPADNCTDVHVSIEEVKKKLSQINPNKAQGPDRVPAQILKELSEELALPLSILFNKSLETGELPADWKKAEVTAIFKKGTKSDPGNYRPVSLTCITCKLLEQFIRDRVVQHMNENKLYSECQHGFRAGRSCMTQLTEVMNDFTKFMDNKESFDVVYLDFRKAFDSVPHKRLLLKLQSYGIKGNLLEWIKNFLTGRTQKVCINGILSTGADVLSGIPQGSILGPILFTIFINDLPDELHSICKIFADDTKIYNSTEKSETIQNDIDKLINWSERWNLYFNDSKCKVMHLGKKNPNCAYKISHNENDKHTLETCREERDLGVVFDSELKFDKHINSAINKGNRMLGLIKRSFTGLENQVLVKLYKSLVRPHLEYGNQIWNPFLKRQSSALEKVQRRATKLIKPLRKLDYEERLRQLKLPTLKYRRIRGDLINTYKILNNTNATNTTLFQLANKDSKTRNNDLKILTQYSRTNIRKNFFTNRVTKYWNNLPAHIKLAQNLTQFKNLLDSHPPMVQIQFDFDP